MAKEMVIERTTFGNDPRSFAKVKFEKSVIPPNFISVMFSDPVTNIPNDLPDHPNLSKPIKISNRTKIISTIWTYVKEPKGRLKKELAKWEDADEFSLIKFHYILRKIFLSAAIGLVALHEAGYAHRNLNLETILVKSRNNARIMGYSLKKDAYQTVEMENYTFDYRAPPPQPGEQPDHFKDDVYALGRIILEAMCNAGNLEVPPEDVFEIIDESLSGSVVDLLTRMLALNQSERMSMAEVAQHEWFNESYEKSENEAKDSGFALINNDRSGLFKEYSDKMRAELKAAGIKILDRVSRGSYGSISKVQLSGKLLEKNNGVEIAAIKVADLSEYNGEMELRETALLLHIEHPNIIRCLGLFKDGKRFLFIVMELAKCALSDVNENHWNVTKEKARDVAKLMKPYLLGMCEGIAFLHRNEWVHRDVKPENVLIKMNDVAAVCDFSYSRQMEWKQLSTTWDCTPMYASPEVLMQKEYDPYASDVWGCGNTIFQCLTGSYLYPQVDRNEMSNEEMEKEFREIPFKLRANKILSPHAIGLLMAMLRFDFDKRPNMQEVLKSKFFKETTQQAVEQPKPGPSRVPDEPRPGPSRAPSGSEPEGRGHKKFMRGS